MKNDNLEKEIDSFINGTYDDNSYPLTYSVAQSFIAKEKDKYIYNEFSFQHELGNYLRKIFSSKNYKIKFELNVKTQYQVKSCKSESDIFILDQNGEAKYAIELKYLKKNCAEPRRMFQCVEDMQFMSDVVKQIKSIDKAFCVVITENTRLYQGESNRNKSIIDSHIKNLNDNLKKIKNNDSKNEVKKQLEYLKEISKNYRDSQKYPTIYDYFRKGNQEAWENGKYVYSQIKKEKPIIKIDEFSNKIKEIHWQPIKDIDEKYQYYILSFSRREHH